jgi:hypothetical protein
LPYAVIDMNGISIGWIFAAMAWFSVFQQPLWVGLLSGLSFGVLRWQVIRKRQGCLGCFVSSIWAWPIALVGGIVWVARAI